MAAGEALERIRASLHPISKFFQQRQGGVKRHAVLSAAQAGKQSWREALANRQHPEQRCGRLAGESRHECRQQMREVKKARSVHELAAVKGFVARAQPRG